MLRYTLFGAIVATADANRRQYHMSTTWLPHLLTNTFTLLLPDLYNAVVPEAQSQDNPAESHTSFEEAWQTVRKPLEVMIKSPSYIIYVTPLALGYILSHPRFNIYKGDLAEIRLAGFGL